MNRPANRNQAAAWVRSEADALIEQAERHARGWDKGPYRDDDTLRQLTIAQRTRRSVSLAFQLSREFAQREDSAPLLAVPAAFYDDHAERALPTPQEVRRAGSRVYIRADDAALASLRSDAAFYADPRCMDSECCPRGIIASARRTLAAIAARTDGAK